jgi:hypothetical protein
VAFELILNELEDFITCGGIEIDGVFLGKQPDFCFGVLTLAAILAEVSKAKISFTRFSASLR